MVKDPVCGMDVDEKKAISYEYEGKKFYFCNDSCLQNFKKNPRKYISSTERRKY